MSSQKKNGTKKETKYDLACGNNKQKGFIGVDIAKKGTQADIQFDILTFPWDFAKDNSTDVLFASHFIEHIPHGDGYNDPFFEFFDEAYRILKTGGTFTIIAPYYTSVRATQDPTHMRSISEATFLYINKNWRKLNKLEHYPVSCNFDVIKIDHAIGQDFTGRATEAVQFAAMHDWNVVNDIIVVLKKV